MAGKSDVDAKHELARCHHEAAGQHDSAAHHHRQAAFYLATGDSALAKKHGISSLEHGQQALNRAQGNVDHWDDYDLETRFDDVKSPAKPMITSAFLCTPGCGHTGSGNSFCCGL
ncbi:MAG: gallidermin/nisin family lantibiotic [Pseudonocardiaceae bacterium]